jgi:hypothetical protein
VGDQGGHPRNLASLQLQFSIAKANTFVFTTSTIPTTPLSETSSRALSQMPALHDQRFGIAGSLVGILYLS